MSHITVAASENAFRELFKVLRDKFKFSHSNSNSFGPYTAYYSVALHLEDGTVDLQNGNKVSIQGLDIKWDKLEAGVGFDIPGFCVGGWCILPTPWGCGIRLPEWCVFNKNPDIGVKLDLSGITSEISATATPVVKYKVDPMRTPVMTDLDAEDAGIPNKWQIFIDPGTIDLDPLDVPVTIGDLLENAVKDAIDNLLSGLGIPGFIKDWIWAALGPIIDLVLDILNIPAGRIAEWFSELIGFSLGLLRAIANVVADHFAKNYPLCKIEDPYPILEESAGMIPVKVPIKNLAIDTNTNEMILTANVGI